MILRVSHLKGLLNDEKSVNINDSIWLIISNLLLQKTAWLSEREREIEDSKYLDGWVYSIILHDEFKLLQVHLHLHGPKLTLVISP